MKPDHEKQERKKNISSAAVMLILLIFMALFGVLLQAYINDSRKYIDSFSREYLNEILVLVEKSCGDMLDSNYGIAEAVSQYMEEATQDKQRSLGDFKAYLDSVYLASTRIEEVLFLKESGSCLNTRGGVDRLDLGAAGISTLFTEKKRVAQYVLWQGESMKFVFAAPFKDSMTLDNETYGAVVLLYDVDILEEMIDIPSFDRKAALYMADKNGEVMICNTAGAEMVGNDTNILDKYVNNSSMTKIEQAEILADFFEGKSGTRLFQKGNSGEAFYFSYMQMREEAFYLICEVGVDRAQNAMVMFQDSINRNAFVLFTTVLGIFLFLSVYFRRSEALERKAEAENARMLQEHNTALQTMNKELKEAGEALERRNAELEKAKNTTEEALRIAEEANRSKSNFLSNMSHDIRTPMNAIVGFSVLLSRDAEQPEKVREYVKKITASSQHLLGLINDVLDMSKIESGKTALNLSEENFGEIIREIDTIVRPQMKAKGHSFNVKVRDIKHESVVVDRMRLNQILLNLLSNAVKYTPDGGNISLMVREMPQRSRQYALYRFVVTDDGLGMSEDFVKNIFDAFTREENSVTNKIQGTGLGMAITKNLVDLMGGKISVKSKKNEGSKFKVELEFRISEHDIDTEFWTRHGITRLLVVDDEEVICRSVEAAMDGTGVLVDYVLDGESAVVMVKRSDEEDRLYNIVLLDWKMPGMNGIETARKIRKEVPKEIPILVLTSYDWTDIEEEARAAGIDAFLPKPFFVTNFRHKIDTLFTKSGEESDETENRVNSALSGKHVLVVEDNEINSEILVEILHMRGATCDVCENGKVALEVFEASKPGDYELILMDVQMPIMNGYEATRAIRAGSHLEAATVPIIAMTANAFAEDINNAIEAGMDAHIAKPVDMDVLEETVREVCEKK